MINIIYSLKNRLLLALLFIVPAANYTISGNLNESQAKNYIQNLIDNLFNPNDHSGSYLKTLKDFSYSTKKVILNRIGIYESFFSFNKTYNSDRIHQEVLKESLNFIEKCSREYVREESYKYQNTSNINNINLNKLTKKISDSIKKEVSDLVKNASYLDTGVFSNYYGVNLVNKINNLISKELTHYAPEKPKPTYPTDECPVCLEDFGFPVKRLFLQCGHNICSTCLKHWYESKGAKTNCPMCRAAIDIQYLIHEF